MKADGVRCTGENLLDPAKVSLKKEESTEEEEEAEEEEEKATAEVSRKIDDDEENVEVDEQGLEFKLCC